MDGLDIVDCLKLAISVIMSIDAGFVWCANKNLIWGGLFGAKTRKVWEVSDKDSVSHDNKHYR